MQLIRIWEKIQGPFLINTVVKFIPASLKRLLWSDAYRQPTVASLSKPKHSHRPGTTYYAGTADYVGTSEWAQLDLQSIQHHECFGHLSI